MTAPSLYERHGGVSSIGTVIDAMVDDLSEGLIGDFWLATDAYIYGYPLVTMEMTRRVFTNVARPEGTHAPMGQLIKMREYPTPAFHDFTAPNADTLYTTAFLDVGEEPWVLSLPDLRDRYALFQCSTGGQTCFRCRVSALREPKRRPTRLPDRAGPGTCRRV